MSCIYTTQGNMLCGTDNKSKDAFIQTQFQGGCPASASTASTASKEHFAGSLAMNQLASSFKAVSGTGIENFASVPQGSSLGVTVDLEGTYGLPWAPF